MSTYEPDLAVERLARAMPCEDPEEPCDADGRDEHRWCDYCIARSVIRRPSVAAEYAALSPTTETTDHECPSEPRAVTPLTPSEWQALTGILNAPQFGHHIKGDPDEGEWHCTCGEETDYVSAEQHIAEVVFRGLEMRPATRPCGEDFYCGTCPDCLSGEHPENRPRLRAARSSPAPAGLDVERLRNTLSIARGRVDAGLAGRGDAVVWQRLAEDLDAVLERLSPPVDRDAPR